MHDSPLIGVISGSLEDAQPCISAIQRGVACAWPVVPEDALSPQQVVARASGLLVCSAGGPNETFLIATLRAALEADMPVLCVGTGMQALNAALGGAAAREVQGHSAHEQDSGLVSSYHRIYIAPGSKLAAIVGSGGFVRVNSRHARGIREAQKSPRLLASAYSLEDGVIETLESPEHPFAIGVQFHPERAREVPPHFMRLFEALAHMARKHSHGP